mgnify:CR=1 FL=1
MDPAAQQQTAACSPFSSNPSGCNQKDGCVFVPKSKDDYSQQCARVAWVVQMNGAGQLMHPIDLCQNVSN